jgi:hypothetical protein
MYLQWLAGASPAVAVQRGPGLLEYARVEVGIRWNGTLGKELPLPY